MSAPNASLSATARPLPMRMRPDLELRAVQMRGRPQWSVKDPLALRYYQLREEEYFILRMLDGRNSIDEIQTRFARRFAPRRLEPDRLHAFLGRLHNEGLILADPAGQGTELLRRRGKLIRQKWLEIFSNVLALQFRGIDPDRFPAASSRRRAGSFREPWRSFAGYWPWRRCYWSPFTSTR